MLTISRYVLRELAFPLIAGSVLLMALFAAYSATDVLGDAATGLLSGWVVWRLVLLKCVIAAEVILPSAMFFAVLWTFERLNRDRELIAFYAGGVGRWRLLQPVVLAGLLVALVVAAMSLEVRPSAYRSSYALEDIGERLRVENMEPGRFYPLGSALVVTGEHVNVEEGYLGDVFAQSREEGEVRIIRAARAYIAPPEADGTQVVEFRDGYAYWLEPASAADRSHQFSRLRYRWRVPRADEITNRRAMPIAYLLGSTAPKEIAEAQWRFVMPMLSFGMMLVAAAIGTLRPGVMTGIRLALGLGAYVLVYNLAAAGRTGVENGALPPLPGIWWVPLVPLVILACVLLGRGRAA